MTSKDCYWMERLLGNKIEANNDSHGQTTSQNGQELSTACVSRWHETKGDGGP